MAATGGHAAAVPFSGVPAFPAAPSPAPLAPSHSSSPLRALGSQERAHGDVRAALSELAARVAHASEESRRRLAAVRLGLLEGCGGEVGTGAREGPAESAAALRAAPSSEALGAMLQRVRIGCARLQPGSAVAAEAQRALSALASAVRALASEEEGFAARAREANAELLREARSRMATTSRALGEGAAAAAEQGRAEEEARGAQASELERQTSGTVLALRDAALESRVFADLRADAAEVVAAIRRLSREGGGAPQGGGRRAVGSGAGDAGMPPQPLLAGDAEGAAAALSRHAATLQGAFVPADVAHAAECVQLAAEEVLAALPALAEAAQGGAGRVPAALLLRVRRAERRRELATMDPSRAAALLSHTRQARAQLDPASEDYGKLSVVEEILAIRAAAPTSPLAQRLSRLAELWELRRAELSGTFAKLREAALLAESIRARAQREGAEGAAKRRAQLAHAHADQVARLRGWAGARESAWRDLLVRDFSASATRICRLASSAASRTLSALHILLPLMAGEAAEAEAEAEDGEPEAHDARGSGRAEGEGTHLPSSLLDRRRLREATEAMLREEEEEEEGDATQTKSTTPAAAPPSEAPTSALPALPSRGGAHSALHAHLIAAFELWVDRAVYVLHRNAQGVVLAGRAIVARLEPESAALRRALAVTLQQSRGESGAEPLPAPLLSSRRDAFL